MAVAAPLSCADSPLLPRMSAWLVVLLVHLLMLLWLLHAGRMLPGGHDRSRISLRWLPAEQDVAMPTDDASPPLPVTVTRQASAPPMGRITDTTAPPLRSGTPQAAGISDTPLRLDLPAGSIDGGDGITAEGVAARLIGRRDVHPAFGPRPARFRIRAQMTPEQIVQGVAQLLGNWPPGYMVDPCRLGQQDMDYFQNAVEEMDRQLLREAVLQVSARCR